MIIWKQILFIFIVAVNLTSIGGIINRKDENFFGKIADEYNWSQHPCRRKCMNDTSPGVCKYVFVIERFYSMSKACYDCPFNRTDCDRLQCIPADGRHKAIYTANRQLPGPLIEVCHNDIIEVEVRNEMLAEGTTIHWHGIKQHGTPYMDGVPYVTQCPIQPGDKFRYIFKASITGTYFWHSHIGSQREDGLYGPLVIKSYDKNNVYNNLYDYDIHRIVVADWMHKSGDDAMAKEYYFNHAVVPHNILINGLGPKKKFKTSSGKFINTPYDVTEVEQNKTYRIRFIDAGSEDCPIEMKIDQHKMLVISLDSNDISAVEVDAITIWPGERIDFILKANQKIGNYWMRMRGFGQCSALGVYQAAILRYKGAKIEEPPGSLSYGHPHLPLKYRVLNPYGHSAELKSSRNVEIPNLESIAANDISLRENVDQQVFIEFDLYPIDNFDFQRKGLYGYHEVPSDRSMGTFQFNVINLKLPPFPLLSQWEMIKPNSLCNMTNVPKTCKWNDCACTHVINLKLNTVVELVFFDQGISRVANVSHPIHLHGYFYRVVAMNKVKGILTIDRFKKLDKQGKIKRNLNRAPFKDTIRTPWGGYTIVRFYANNPGYWFLHCHFEQHNNIGMALIFKVGEHKDFPPKPKNFPQCGNFLPTKL